MPPGKQTKCSTKAFDPYTGKPRAPLEHPDNNPQCRFSHPSDSTWGTAKIFKPAEERYHATGNLPGNLPRKPKNSRRSPSPIRPLGSEKDRDSGWERGRRSSNAAYDTPTAPRSMGRKSSPRPPTSSSSKHAVSAPVDVSTASDWGAPRESAATPTMRVATSPSRNSSNLNAGEDRRPSSTWGDASPLPDWRNTSPLPSRWNTSTSPTWGNTSPTWGTQAVAPISRKPSGATDDQSPSVPGVSSWGDHSPTVNSNLRPSQFNVKDPWANDPSNTTSYVTGAFGDSWNTSGRSTMQLSSNILQQESSTPLSLSLTTRSSIMPSMSAPLASPITSEPMEIYHPPDAPNFVEPKEKLKRRIQWLEEAVDLTRKSKATQTFIEQIQNAPEITDTMKAQRIAKAKTDQALVLTMRDGLIDRLVKEDDPNWPFSHPTGAYSTEDTHAPQGLTAGLQGMLAAIQADPTHIRKQQLTLVPNLSSSITADYITLPTPNSGYLVESSSETSLAKKRKLDDADASAGYPKLVAAVASIRLYVENTESNIKTWGDKLEHDILGKLDNVRRGLEKSRQKDTRLTEFRLKSDKLLKECTDELENVKRETEEFLALDKELAQQRDAMDARLTAIEKQQRNTWHIIHAQRRSLSLTPETFQQLRDEVVLSTKSEYSPHMAAALQQFEVGLKSRENELIETVLAPIGHTFALIHHFEQYVNDSNGKGKGKGRALDLF